MAEAANDGGAAGAAGMPWTARVRVSEGRLAGDAPEAAMVERVDARGRAVRAFLLAEPLGAGAEPFLEAMVRRAAEQFEPSGRSLTGALQAAVASRHAELREWNRAQLPGAQAAYGLSCLLIREGEPPILGQAGPSLALIAGRPGADGRRPLSLRGHGGEDPIAAPVGGAAPLRMQFVQGGGEGGWALLLASNAAGLLDPAGRAAVSRLGGEQVLQHLYQGLLRLKESAALMIDLDQRAGQPAYRGAAAADPFEQPAGAGEGGGE